MSCTPEPCQPPAGLGVLVALKLRLLRNLVVQAVTRSPLSVAVSCGFVLLIWLGLFGLFAAIFDSFQRTPLEKAVVIPIIFNIFFVAMLVLLAFSNALLVYGSLFNGREPSFLLATPIAPVNLVLVKYLESLFFASWSLILLGLPLMMAMAQTYEDEATAFYPLFVAFFLFFVPIPGAIGLVLAYVAARFLPRDGKRILISVALTVLVLAAFWSIRTVRDVELADHEWMAGFLGRMQFVEAAILPSSWVAHGIEQTLARQYAPALGYLAVTLANGLLASWIAVALCGRGLSTTYDRATCTGNRSRYGRTNGQRGGPCEWAFFYLPLRLRLIAAKDLRTFFRDPMQWSQLAIFFGLMVLYLLNVPRFYVELSASSLGMVVPFLNLCAITLILATFTSRFVFPLVSLEGHQLWLVGLLPMKRSRILHAKFAYALTVTAAVSILVTTLAAVSLEMDWRWALVEIAIVLAVCVGLCGLAVGLGARLPLFKHSSAGRIANSFGGTVNLIASVALVATVLAGMALIVWQSRGVSPDAGLSTANIIIAGSVVLCAVAAGLSALHVGARHFNRLEV